jgi:tetratricopeptide (TPR) repeat protein
MRVMTSRTYDIVRGTVLLVIALSAMGWFFFRCLRRSEDPARFLFKWLLTVPTIWILFWKVGPIANRQDPSAIMAVPLAAICGLVLAAIWRHNISNLVARPFSSLYDGGNEEPIPKPAYSVAQSKQKKGQYLEAIAEIRKQLERFPTDAEGQLLIAQIQAEDLKDLPAAELTLEHFCAQPGHAPQNIVFALYSLADWHLKITQDREAAQRHLQKILELFPESEFSLGAANRIAHLSSAEMLLASQDRKKFIVAEGPRNLGLLKEWGQMLPAEPGPEQAAAQYVKHLEQHPLDMEAREKLAVIYADHYKRLDLATDELEQMIGQPNQPGRLVVHWLNLLADLQIRNGIGFDTVRDTLQRIVDRAPDAAAAEIARHRLALLKLEMKPKAMSQAVKLGSYEHNIGLKRGSPGR